MISSGLDPIETNGSGEFVVIADRTSSQYAHVVIVNEGSAPGFFSINGGQCWCRLPANATTTLDGVSVFGRGVLVKRAGDVDLSGIFAFVY